MKRVLVFLWIAILLAACSQPVSPTAVPPTPAPPTAVPPTAVPPTAVPSTDAPPTAEPATPAALTEATPFYIVDLHFVDALDGWLLDSAWLLRTEDGGKTWYNVWPDERGLGQEASAFFLDAAQAWVLIPDADHQGGELYHTVDGGYTWARAQTPFSRAQIQFLDAQTGFALTDMGAAAGSMAVALYKTTDGGVTWTRVFTNDPNLEGANDTLPLSGIKMGFAFRDAQVGWITGTIYAPGEVYLYKTTDGGATWSQQPLELPEAFADSQVAIESPVFAGLEQGLLPVSLLGNLMAQNVYRTLDGGETWLTGFPLNVSAVTALAPPDVAVMWDGGAKLYLSEDGGETWRSVDTNVDVSGDLWLLDFVDAAHGWAVTTNADGEQTLYYTEDGGATWSILWH